MSFTNPGALLLILALVPLAIATATAMRRRAAADRAWGGAPQLQRGRSVTLRTLQLGLLVVAVVLATLGAARPRWGSEPQAIPRVGIDIAVALDISRSMTATDVEPSRADGAAAGLQDMLAHLRGDRVGLVTFAGEAFERSPLTLDLEAVGQLIERAQGETALVRPGTALGDALAASLRLLAVSDPADTQVIVLLSDGEELAGELDAALAAAAERSVRVYAVVAGTEAGGVIPPLPNRPSSDEVTRADRTTLQTIADETRGELRELDSLAGLAVEFQRLRQSQFDEGEQRVPVERSHWFFGAAAAALLLATVLPDAGFSRRLRRQRIGTLGAPSSGALPTALLGLGVLSALLAACGTGTYRDIDAGNEAFAVGSFEDALTAYSRAADRLEADGKGESPDALRARYNAGNALHELGRHADAIEASASVAATTEEPELLLLARYAVGNHAYRLGDHGAALEAYVAVLLRDPTDLDAKHNLEMTLRALGVEPVLPPPELSPGSGPGDADPSDADGDEPGDGGEPSDGDGDTPPDPRDGDQPSDDTDDGDSTPPDDAASSDGSSDPTGDPGGRTRAELLAEAQAQLSEALLAAGEELTLEEALAILDLTRRLSELSALESGPPSPGVPDR